MNLNETVIASPNSHSITRRNRESSNTPPDEPGNMENRSSDQNDSNTPQDHFLESYKPIKNFEETKFSMLAQIVSEDLRF